MISDSETRGRPAHPVKLHGHAAIRCADRRGFLLVSPFITLACAGAAASKLSHIFLYYGIISSQPSPQLLRFSSSRCFFSIPARFLADAMNGDQSSAHKCPLAVEQPYVRPRISPIGGTMTSIAFFAEIISDSSRLSLSDDFSLTLIGKKIMTWVKIMGFSGDGGHAQRPRGRLRWANGAFLQYM